MSKVLIIGHVWPEPASSAAGTRMMQLLSFFQTKGHRVIFATQTALSTQSVDLSAMDIETVEIKLNSPDFDDFIGKLSPDIVVFDRFMTEEQYGWRVGTVCPKALRILDAEDLHFLRKARQLAIQQTGKLDDVDLFSEMAKREIASIYRCDLTLVISDYEWHLLTKQFEVSGNLLMYLPLFFDDLEVFSVQEQNVFEHRAHFVSIGNFLHPPNWDAVLQLKTQIWPLIRKELPEAELHIYGAYAGSKAMALHQPNAGFLVKGFVEDANAMMRGAKLCLAPLRFGAGLKGKLLSAMYNGTPSITTQIGAEGLCDTLGYPGAVADQAEDFAAAACQLYRDRNLWNQAQRKGFELLTSRFEAKNHLINLSSCLSGIQDDLDGHRRRNFIGQMLQHHRVQSTRYLSKWIEEKQKGKPLH